MHAVLYFIRSPKETSDKPVGLVTWPLMQSGHQPLGSDSNEKTWLKWPANENQIHPHVWPGQANHGQPFNSYSLSSNQTDSRLPFLQPILEIVWDFTYLRTKFHFSKDRKKSKGKSDSVAHHSSKYPWSVTVVVTLYASSRTTLLSGK